MLKTDILPIMGAQQWFITLLDGFLNNMQAVVILVTSLPTAVNKINAVFRVWSSDGNLRNARSADRSVVVGLKILKDFWDASGVSFFLISGTGMCESVSY